MVDVQSLPTMKINRRPVCLHVSRPPLAAAYSFGRRCAVS